MSIVRQMRYKEVLQRLYERNVMVPAKMGLESSERLYELIGRPLDGVPTVHVAGTNGKGSVCYKMSQVFQAGGLKTGLFVSPHISSYRERVVVDDAILTEEEVIVGLQDLISLCEDAGIPATVFELNTALAFCKFKRVDVDAVALEVGLGGRLDSTNVVTPSLSVITSIQMDHTRILGDTLEKIAFEKAGIIKPGVPVLVGPDCPIEVFRQVAEERGAPLYRLHDVLSMHSAGISVDPDILNTNIARAAALILEDVLSEDCDSGCRDPRSAFSSSLAIEQYSKKKAKVASALTSLRIKQPGTQELALKSRSPCRFEVVRKPGSNVDVVLDVAHNVDSIGALMAAVSRTYRNPNGAPCHVHVVVGMSQDKCLSPAIQELLLQLSHGCFLGSLASVAASHPRAADSKEILSIAGNLGVPKADLIDHGHDVAGAVRAAILRAEANQRSGRSAVVVTCGSAFIMSAARRELGIDEPRDDNTLNSVLRKGDTAAEDDVAKVV